MSEINEACSLLYSCHLWAQTGKYKKHSSLYLFFPNSGTWYPLKQVKTLAWISLFFFFFLAASIKNETRKNHPCWMCVFFTNVFEKSLHWNRLLWDVKIYISAFASQTVNFICMSTKAKSREMLFCELSYVSWTFYNRREPPQGPFPHSCNKGMSQFI